MLTALCYRPIHIYHQLIKVFLIADAYDFTVFDCMPFKIKSTYHLHFWLSTVPKVFYIEMLSRITVWESLGLPLNIFYIPAGKPATGKLDFTAQIRSGYTVDKVESGIAQFQVWTFDNGVTDVSIIK